MAAETYVIGGLGTLVTVLGTIVAASLNKRLDTLEQRQNNGDTAAQTLAIAVAKLTVEVSHLNAALSKLDNS